MVDIANHLGILQMLTVLISSVAESYAVQPHPKTHSQHKTLYMHVYYLSGTGHCSGDMCDFQKGSLSLSSDLTTEVFFGCCLGVQCMH